MGPLNSFPLVLLTALVLIGCQKSQDLVSPAGQNLPPWLSEVPREPSPENVNLESAPVLLKEARLLTATGANFEKGYLLLNKGRIQKISDKPFKVPKGTQVIEAAGLTVTPGLIDAHSHMGVYPAPHLDAHQDGNEMARNVTSDVWAEHGFWPQDPDLWKALAGGITTIHVLPGSANHIGGRTYTAKLVPGTSARQMRVFGAPQGLKMACGENPKRTHRKAVETRMGNVAQYRRSFQEAVEYMREWEDYVSGGKKGKAPKRNFVLETLAQVIRGDILLHFHCYRADEIHAILDVAQEFGFKIRTIHHGLEAFKLAGRLGQEGVGVATWADWWGFKGEAYDGIPANLGLLQSAGAKAIVHSDSPIEVRHLNVEAGKALARARELGLEISEDQALQWITLNAAWAIGLDQSLGTLETGKLADVVVWDGHPFSIRSQAQMVFIRGEKVFDRAEGLMPRSDFEIGQAPKELSHGRAFPNRSKPPEQMAWPTLLNLNPQSLNARVLLQNAKIFWQDKWQEGLSLRLRDGLVLEVGAQLTPDAEEEVIDAGGKWISPGLIDSTSQLGLFEIEMDSRAQDLRGDNLLAADRKARDALNRQTVRIPIWRRQGVTSVIAHNLDGLIGGQSLAMDLNQPARLLQAENGLWSSVVKSPWGRSSKNRSDQWHRLRQVVADAQTYLRNPSGFESGNARPLKSHPNDLKALAPYLRGQKPWIFQMDRRSDIETLLRFRAELGQMGFSPRLAIWGGAESWLLAEELKKAKIPVLLSTANQSLSDFDNLYARPDLAATLQEKGVELIITDVNSLGAPRLRQEAGLAVQFGLSPEAALKAITEAPAAFFGLSGRGEIQVKKPAHLVVWSGDPLEPSSSAEQIWIEGERQSLETRHDLLMQKYSTPPRAAAP